MQDSDAPAKFTYAFAASATGTYIRAVPPTTVDPDAASQQYGFPSATFTPTTSGGVAPDGRDFNGILNQITAWNQWQQMGGPIIYDSTFQSTISGYPKGSIVTSATTPGKLWQSTTENNVTNPDTGGAGWTAWVFGSGLTSAVTSITAGTGLSGGVITSTGTIALQQASTSQLGGVKVDGTSITISGGGVISSLSSGGTVTSVGLSMPAIFSVASSPVTASGTLTVTLATQSANRLWAGPTSGAASAPTFRALVPADLPVASSSQLGAVQADGTSILVTGGGVVSAQITSGANTFTGPQTLAGTSSNLAEILTNAAEPVTVTATAASGTIAFNIATQSVLYYTSNATGNWTVNLRLSSGTTLGSALAVGQEITVAFLVTQGATAYYNSSIQVDGTTSGVTVKWQGSVPSAGNVNAIDVYTYSVIKTGAGAYTVLASQTPFV